MIQTEKIKDAAFDIVKESLTTIGQNVIVKTKNYTPEEGLVLSLLVPHLLIECLIKRVLENVQMTDLFLNCSEKKLSSDLYLELKKNIFTLFAEHERTLQ